MSRKGLCCVQINLQKLWVTLGSIMVSLTFVFGNNMRSIYEAVVYLFVVHPYDVGDAVLVGPQQDWCTVRLMLPLSPLQPPHLALAQGKKLFRSSPSRACVTLSMVAPVSLHRTLKLGMA